MPRRRLGRGLARDGQEDDEYEAERGAGGASHGSRIPRGAAGVAYSLITAGGRLGGRSGRGFPRRLFAIPSRSRLDHSARPLPATTPRRLDDESVAPVHAVIEISGDEVQIIDLGSSTGTVLPSRDLCLHSLFAIPSLDLGPQPLSATSSYDHSTDRERRSPPARARLAAPLRSTPPILTRS
ncbi:MAG: FHA domain-containing protein [Nannocystaceae bacterium]